MAEDEMVRWRRWLNGHECGRALGAGGGQRLLVHCGPRHPNELDLATEQHFSSGEGVSVRSVAQSCLTLCDPMDCSTPGFPVLPHHPEFLKLMCIELVMPPTTSSSVTRFLLVSGSKCIKSDLWSDRCRKSCLLCLPLTLRAWESANMVILEEYFSRVACLIFIWLGISQAQVTMELFLLVPSEKLMRINTRGHTVSHNSKDSSFWRLAASYVVFK